MAEFFDITKDSRALFEGLAIMDTPYAKEMNQHPVIFISLANCKETYTILKVKLYESLRAQFAKYRTIFEKDELDADLLDRVRKLYNELVNFGDMEMITSALYILSEFLYVVYGKEPMIFIDEYDTPFIEAHTKGFYNEVHGVLASLMRTTLKGNEYMQYAMITGIQRVAKENVFSDLNNLKVYTVNERPYAEYFGFTPEETKALLAYYDVPYNNEVKHMYNGYNMGGLEIYNPWSIVNYAQGRKLDAYWVNTSSSTMIKNAMHNADSDFKSEYEELIINNNVETVVDLETSFYEYKDSDSLWGLLVNAGYLTISEINDDLYTLRIPNNEVKKEFEKLTAAYLHVSKSSLTSITQGLLKKNQEKFVNSYRKFIKNVLSYYDIVNENSIHMLFLGMSSYFDGSFDIKSNRESGNGRSEVLPCGYLILRAKIEKHASYVFEFKYTNDKNADLKELANDAINQIKVKEYDCELSGNIIHIGLAHCGKNVEMIWKKK